MKEWTSREYIEFYVEQLKRNPKVFNQQNTFISSQIKASQQLFKRMFKDDDFNTQARNYLKSIKILE